MPQQYIYHRINVLYDVGDVTNGGVPGADSRNQLKSCGEMREDELHGCGLFKFPVRESLGYHGHIGNQPLSSFPLLFLI